MAKSKATIDPVAVETTTAFRVKQVVYVYNRDLDTDEIQVVVDIEDGSGNVLGSESIVMPIPSFSAGVQAGLDSLLGEIINDFASTKGYTGVVIL